MVEAPAPTRPSSSDRAAQPHPESRDLFRDTLLRFTAFTSDLGESFKPFISRRFYLLSYGVVAAYGLADTTSRGMHAYTAARGDAATTTTTTTTTTGCSSGSAAAAVPLATRTAGAFADSARELAGACSDCLAPGCAVASSAAEPHSAAVPVAAAVLDSVLWHGAASLVIPGVMINRAVWASGRLLERLPRAPPRLRAAGPSALGLALIPIAVPHIDEGVTRWMDVHVRPHLGTGQNS